jgi:hypothetical protein
MIIIMDTVINNNLTEWVSTRINSMEVEVLQVAYPICSLIPIGPVVSLVTMISVMAKIL